MEYTKLWSPSQQRSETSGMHAFMMHINKVFNKNFNTFSELFDWSINNIPDFWEFLEI